MLIAALISGAGAPRALVQRWLAGDFELIVSPALLAELESTLMRKKFRTYATELEVRAYVALLRRLATSAPDPPLISGLTPDPSDDYLVVLARGSGARVLVSGDRHLCELVDPVPPVLRPRDFLNRLTREP